jgi:hypothetical protein
VKHRRRVLTVFLAVWRRDREEATAPAPRSCRAAAAGHSLVRPPLSSSLTVAEPALGHQLSSSGPSIGFRMGLNCDL